MAENTYQCSCGKVFKTAQGLAGHKRFCNKAERHSGDKKGVTEGVQKLSELQENYEVLSDLYAESVQRLNELEEKVDALIRFICPTGRNLVGVNSSKIIEISSQVSALESEMHTSQEKLEREIKGWVWNVIPERFRPKG